MAANTGRAVIVEFGGAIVEDELRTKTITFAGEPTDITTADDDGWITYLDGTFNSTQWTVALEGVEKNSTFADAAESGTAATGTITVGDRYTLTGSWRVTGYSAGAPHVGEQTFSCTLSSTGSVTKAAVV